MLDGKNQEMMGEVQQSYTFRATSRSLPSELSVMSSESELCSIRRQAFPLFARPLPWVVVLS